MGVTLTTGLAIAFAAATAVAGPKVVSTFVDREAAADGVSAELVEAASGLSAAALIDGLASHEAIKPATAKTVQGRQKTNPISSRGYVVGLGGALYFYYRDPSPAGAPARVCQVKAEKNIRSAERLRAVRWCYRELGGLT